MKLVAFLGVAALAMPAMAAPGFEKGNWAMTLSGGGNSSKEFKDSSFSLNISPSYFVTDNVELGLRQTGAYNGGFQGQSLGFADFDFSLGSKSFVPFAGANIGYSYGHNVDDSWAAGPEAGLKYFVNDTTYLYGLIAYEFNLKDSINKGSWLYNVGIGFKW
jgi:hypothetical protein